MTASRRWMTRMVALAICGLSVPGFAGGLYNTTTGVQETVPDYGGISPQEIDQLQQDTQKLIKKYQQGRASTSEGGNGRYSGILEMHDANFDGVTDHNNADNALEGGTEKVATKGKTGLSDAARKLAIEQARGSTGNCHMENNVAVSNQKDSKGNALPCYNISGVLVDRGQAHGGADEEHRVYEMDDTALANSKAAGQKYADQTIQDASNYGSTAGLQQVQQDSKAGYMKVTNMDGATTSEKVNANIDLLRSEASWAEQQKQRTIDAEWKTIRAKRLANLPTLSNGTSVADPELEALVQKGDDAGVAKRVAELRANVDNTLVCSSTGKAPENGRCADGKDAIPLATYSQGKSVQDVKAAYAAAEQGNKGLQKNIAQEASKVAQCMQSGVWCSSNGAGSGANATGPLAPVKTDIGLAYQDDREVIYHNLSIATKGPLSNFMKTMSTNVDFSAANDAKTHTKPFASMQKEWQTASDAAAAVQKRESQRSDTGFNQKNFNANTMSAVKLFGRDSTRDGTTLSGGGERATKLTNQGISGSGGGGGTPSPASLPSAN